MNEKKKQTGRVNIVRGLAAVYLLVLAFRLLRSVAKGETEMVAVSAIGGLVFAAVGAVLAYGEWKAYRFGLEHKDDPETWNDNPETENSDEDQ